MSARASRRAFAFGSFARKGLIGARPGVGAAVEGRGAPTEPGAEAGVAGAAGGVIGPIPGGRVTGAVGREATGGITGGVLGAAGVCEIAGATALGMGGVGSDGRSGAENGAGRGAAGDGAAGGGAAGADAAGVPGRIGGIIGGIIGAGRAGVGIDIGVAGAAGGGGITGVTGIVGRGATAGAANVGACGSAAAGGATPAVPRALIAALGLAANSSSIELPAPTAMTPPQTEQRARTPAAGIFDGSTRKTDRHSGHETFTYRPPLQSRFHVAALPEPIPRTARPSAGRSRTLSRVASWRSSSSPSPARSPAPRA